VDASLAVQVRSGKAMARIRLAPGELSKLQQPEALFLLLARSWCAPFYFQRIHEHFKDYIPPSWGASSGPEVWLEYDGHPIRWDAPLGAVVAALGAEREPWEITAHFQGYPETLEAFTPSLLQPRVMNCIREAVVLLRGTVNPVMKLPKAAQLSLWESLEQEDASTFFDAVQGLVGPLEQIQRVPVRLHWHPHGSLLAPVRPFDSDGTPTTLEAYLTALDLPIDAEVTWQGVLVPADTPIIWLFAHGMSPDLFVHLSLVVRNDMYGSVTSLGMPPE
jgi:hypothetical protein